MNSGFRGYSVVFLFLALTLLASVASSQVLPGEDDDAVSLKLEDQFCCSGEGCAEFGLNVEPCSFCSTGLDAIQAQKFRAGNLSTSRATAEEPLFQIIEKGGEIFIRVVITDPASMKFSEFIAKQPLNMVENVNGRWFLTKAGVKYVMGFVKLFPRFYKVSTLAEFARLGVRIVPKGFTALAGPVTVLLLLVDGAVLAGTHLPAAIIPHAVAALRDPDDVWARAVRHMSTYLGARLASGGRDTCGRCYDTVVQEAGYGGVSWTRAQEVSADDREVAVLAQDFLTRIANALSTCACKPGGSVARGGPALTVTFNTFPERSAVCP